VARQRILLDACVAINLAAADALAEIADRLCLTFVMVAQAEAEAGHLRELVDGEPVLAPLHLSKQTRRGVFEIIELDPADYALYVELAALVDDGEAATIALAIQHGLELATDDRKARKLCVQRGLAEPARTLALLRDYAAAAQLDDESIAAMLIRVRQRASFQPPRADPALEWWNSYLGT
jgi:predicted nucleic acid-binding protein